MSRKLNRTSICYFVSLARARRKESSTYHVSPSGHYKNFIGVSGAKLIERSVYKYSFV